MALVRYTILLAAFLVAGAPGASAGDIELAGARLPDSTRLDHWSLRLNGAGLRTLLGFEIYVAALYLPSPRHETAYVLDPGLPRSLRIILLRDISTHRNLEALKIGLRDNNSSEDLTRIEHDVDQFLKWLAKFGEARKGSVLRLDYAPGLGTRVIMNGHEVGVIPGEAFNVALMKIWLGENPIQVDLKKALLGAT
jgi:hypothetical protein